tara:strand:+ start:10533 stop:11270 length:738 start_codon:yes stop_codon:yes gene_type:complete
MKRNVYLDGELGAKYGRELVIYAQTPADIFRNLECNFPDIREYLIDCHNKDIGFIFEIGSERLEDEEELLMTFGEGDVYISPQPAGSKSGFGKILAAIAIVVIMMTPGLREYFIATTKTYTAVAGGAGVVTKTVYSLKALGYIAAAAAVMLAATGLQQMMAPDPAVDDFNTDRETTYLFRGAEQVILEGDPVPVVYGQLRVPARPIGFEIRNKDKTISNTYYNGGIWGGFPGWTNGFGFNFGARK